MIDCLALLFEKERVNKNNNNWLFLYKKKPYLLNCK
jgi:hypothetical protein